MTRADDQGYGAGAAPVKPPEVRGYSSTNETSSTTCQDTIRPSSTLTFWSLTHAPDTLRSVCAARSTPVRTASSKLVSDRAEMWVMRATDALMTSSSSNSVASSLRRRGLLRTRSGARVHAALASGG